MAPPRLGRLLVLVAPFAVVAQVPAGAHCVLNSREGCWGNYHGLTNKLETSHSKVATGRNSYASPTYGDLDGDGDVDLIVGWTDGKGESATGRLSFYRNNGGIFELDENFLLVSALQSVSPPIGLKPVPVLADLDNAVDGIDCLIVGDELDLRYFELVKGPSGANDFLEDTNFFASVKTAVAEYVDDSYVARYMSPAVGDVDGDTDLDLLLTFQIHGESFESMDYLLFFRDDTAPWGWTINYYDDEEADPIYSALDFVYSIGTMTSLSVAMADINGDGWDDLLIGAQYDDASAGSPVIVALSSEDQGNRQFLVEDVLTNIVDQVEYLKVNGLAETQSWAIEAGLFPRLTFVGNGFDVSVGTMAGSVLHYPNTGTDDEWKYYEQEKAADSAFSSIAAGTFWRAPALGDVDNDTPPPPLLCPICDAQSRLPNGTHLAASNPATMPVVPANMISFDLPTTAVLVDASTIAPL